MIKIKKTLSLLLITVSLVISTGYMNVSAKQRFETVGGKNKIIVYTSSRAQTVYIQATKPCIISMYDGKGKCLWSSDWSNMNLYYKKNCYKNFCYEGYYWCGKDVYYIMARSIYDRNFATTAVLVDYR